ncbi:hypothetical protein [Alkalihalobacillus sp. LMS39]|uniref:hypothetical protein n=1 Tax=Alkalihalobacillus sp. LMS39 TaxID=2924032 RepID=UPI001FB248A7|nr:hypothetical protein [Alkalihalobacillus sp. LMS39]UOE94103.1 hypothetical protein MM271_23520 [Alkalihalobacillus sp. LMS39]
MKKKEVIIEDFLNYFLGPIFSYYANLPVNSLIGRYSVETIIQEHRPIGEILVELNGCSNQTAEEISSSLEMSELLSRFDQDDFRVWLTPIQEECDYILTSNQRRVPSEIGSIKRIHPSGFYERLTNP